MKQPNKQPLFIYLAPLVGAILFGSLLPLDNFTYTLYKHGYISDSLANLFEVIGFFIVMPSGEINMVLFGRGDEISPYIVNPILGALIFFLLPIFWKLYRGMHDQEK